ncbi:MAG TPA: hypothetical protein VFO80_00295 [Sphingomonas sp.]|nr:hypothetical protein [Sphingomonas sp.]
MAVASILALVLAQATTPAAPPPAAPPAGAATIQTSAQAFSACLGPKVGAVPATMTPEQGADSVLAACKTEQDALRSAVEAMLATAPAEYQTMGRQQLNDGMAQARTQIADSIRQKRAAPATPAAPAAPTK